MGFVATELVGTVNSENIILSKIDRVVNPDGVRILCKYLGKIIFCYDEAMTDQKSKQSNFFILFTYSNLIKNRSKSLKINYVTKRRSSSGKI